MEPWVRKQHERYAREEAARKVPNPTVDWRGRACFPEGITEIRDHTFDRNKDIRTAVLPNTIKRIGVRAFADCSNLEELVLNEGLEEIDSNIFTGCTSLKSVVFPDSVKKVEAFAFYSSSFQEPVLSASGDVLYQWPEVPGEKKMHGSQSSKADSVRCIFVSGRTGRSGYPGRRGVHPLAVFHLYRYSEADAACFCQICRSQKLLEL